MAMDEFCLDEVETVVSDYDLEECNSLLQESMVISSMDSLYDSTTDTDVLWANLTIRFFNTIHTTTSSITQFSNCNITMY